MSSNDIIWPSYDFVNFPSQDKSNLMSSAHEIIADMLQKQELLERKQYLLCLHPDVIVEKLTQFDGQYCKNTNSYEMCTDHVMRVLNVWRKINGMQPFRSNMLYSCRVRCQTQPLMMMG